jgi:hypothetical protein
MTATEVRPVFDAPLVDEDDAEKAAAREISKVDSRIGEVDVWERIETTTLGTFGLVPPGLRIVEEVLEASPRAQRVDHAIAIEVDEPNLPIAKIEARGLTVPAKRTTIPFAVVVEREVTGEAVDVRAKIDSSVPVGIEQRHPRICERNCNRRIPHGPSDIEAAITEVSPGAKRTSELNGVDESVSSHIDELDRRFTEKGRCSERSGHLDQPSSTPIHACELELERRKRFGLSSIAARNFDAAEERAPCRRQALVEIR